VLTRRHKPIRLPGIGLAGTGLVILSLLSAGAMACSPSDPEPQTETPAVHTPTEILDLARQILVRDCMAHQGFRVWLTAPNPIADDKSFPYVIDDLAWAQQHGYGSDIEQQIARLRSEDPNAQYFASLPSPRREAASVALHGPVGGRGVEVRLPTGGVVGHSDQGCDAEAQQKLYGDFAAWYRATSFVQSLSGQRRGLVLADDRYKKALVPWADCMRANGMAYSSPAQARDAARDKERFDRGAEIKLATAEASCAASSGLSAVAQQLDQIYADRAKQRYVKEVTAEARLRESALPRAKEIVKTEQEGIDHARKAN
jgi:hypothetical protein